MSFNTKLFFDEELNSTLLEGGAKVSKSRRGGSSELSGSKRKGKAKPEPVADEEQDGLKPFDVVVQRGTNHAWANNGSEPALLIAVLIDSNIRE